MAQELHGAHHGHPCACGKRGLRRHIQAAKARRRQRLALALQLLQHRGGGFRRQAQHWPCHQAVPPRINARKVDAGRPRDARARREEVWRGREVGGGGRAALEGPHGHCEHRVLVVHKLVVHKDEHNAAEHSPANDALLHANAHVAKT